MTVVCSIMVRREDPTTDMDMTAVYLQSPLLDEPEYMKDMYFVTASSLFAMAFIIIYREEEVG